MLLDMPNTMRPVLGKVPSVKIQTVDLRGTELDYKTIV